MHGTVRHFRLCNPAERDPHVAVFDVNSIVQSLSHIRHDWREAQRRSREPGGREFPSRDAVAGVVDALKGALFPMRLGPTDLRHESEDFYVGHTLDSALHALLAQVRLELAYMGRHAPRPEAEIEAQAETAVNAFAAALPGIRMLLDSDVLA
ncbi:MAG: serine acetyltransferase, partial [Rhodoferax sp.]|nr:serine acetyltransferase [Rhodoferax sp.]